MITEKELYERCRCVEFLQLGIIEKRLRQNLGIDENEPTIEDLKDQNINDLKELYELYEAELSRFKHVISARDLTINSLTSMCQSGGTERNKLASTIDELKETIRLERIDHTAERSVLNQKYHDDLRSQKATIKHLYNRIDELEHGNDGRVAFLHGEVEGLEAELSARRKDSEVLMKVADIVRDDTIGCSGALGMIGSLLTDYLGPPEGPHIDDLYEVSVTYAFLEMP